MVILKGVDKYSLLFYAILGRKERKGKERKVKWQTHTE